MIRNGRTSAWTCPTTTGAGSSCSSPARTPRRCSSPRRYELLTGHVPDPTALNIVRARVYTHHSRVAARFLDGRICLVGDAAHLMPPWAGQDMNTGIRDATNVTWKLAAVATGRAHPRILSTYDTERHAHATAMLGLSDTLGRVLSSTSAGAARTRDVLLRALTRAPQVRDWLLEG
ncbi:FAD-dependent monooxygenase [Streptomyces sp. NPDC005799]|uniref:FAD-dependent monooxygenase n=1 Tax=Streptomyces sp. NPDC005799 TaxID=3154678 RepID=UPI0033F99BB3